MNAKVEIINNKRGMIAAKSEDGEYVIVELLGGYDLEIGDIISHNDFYSMGSEEYYNISKSEMMSVYVQNVCGNFQQAKKQCFL